MILVDTSVWIDHLRRSDAILQRLLEDQSIAVHPHVIAEIMLGSLRDRDGVLELLANLPEVVVAYEEEVLRFIHNWRLWGRGIGFVDVHLLAAAHLTPGIKLWTRDSRLREAAAELRVAADLD